ncbi:MAG: thioredoxin family protein [Bacteroidales bacterium]|nr:thioredoxin family protein [Bacteroidales bacterium]
MKTSLLTFITMLFATITLAQNSVYDPTANAEKDIQEAVSKAEEDNKHVFVMIGGNWCPWCMRLHKFLNNDREIDSLLRTNYVMVKVNYSEENKNKKVLADLGYPQRFGFPVLVILDQEGKRIHTQSTVFLEEGKGYNKKTVKEFLKNWSPKALDPAQYD